MMALKQIRQILLIFAIVGALLIGGYKAYCTFAPDIVSSRIVKQLGGE